VPLAGGSRLPPASGKILAGIAGWIYGKRFQDTPDNQPLAFWLAFDNPIDTRLFPGQVDQRVFAFANRPARIRVRLIYRRLWQPWIEEYGWSDQEMTIADQTVLGQEATPRARRMVH